MDTLLQDNSQRLWQYLIGVGGAILVLLAIAKLLGDRRQPTNTVAWLLAIIFLPWFAVPLYLLVGGRKLQRLARRKSRIVTARPPASTPTEHALCPTALVLAKAGSFEPVSHNEVRLLHDGVEAFEVLAAHIRKAKHSIHITTFILSRDDTGKRLIKLLAEKARSGVKVRLLLDTIGSFSVLFGFCRPLLAAGGELRWFMPVLPFWNARSSANLRNHRKIAVFDESSAIVGGHNLAKEYMGPSPYRKRWKDVGALLSGPAVSHINEIFWADWNFAGKEEAEPLTPLAAATSEGPGRSRLQVVASGPDVDGDPLYECILSMIQEANSSIRIATPYFIPDEVLLRSLIVKARAGHDVRLVVPSRPDHRLTDLACRHYLRELRKAGAKVYYSGPAMMHSKCIVVDTRLALIGSANFDIRSLFVNFEIGVVLYSKDEVAALNDYLDALEQQASQEPPRGHREESLLGRLAEDLSRLLAPLL